MLEACEWTDPVDTLSKLECILPKMNTTSHSQDMLSTLNMDSGFITGFFNDWEPATLIIRSVALIDVFLLKLMFVSYFNHKKFIKLSRFSKHAIYIKHVSREICKAVIGIFLLTVLFPINGPLFFCLFIYREIIKVIQRRKYGARNIVAALDSMWGIFLDDHGIMDKKSPPYINVAMVMEGQPCKERIIKRVQEQIIDVKDSDGNYVYWKFSHVLKFDMGYFVWVKAPVFDISNHVRFWKDPLDNISCSEDKNGNIVSTEKPEKDDEIGLISRFMSDQGFSFINPDTPQWEVVVLMSSCMSNNKYVTVVKMNHCLGDGTSLMRLILAKLTDNPILVQPKGLPKLHPILNFFALLYSFSFYPVDFITSYLSSDKNPIHDGANTGKKVCSLSPSVSLDKIKQIKNAAGCTVNDVFMSCFSGALARTFTNRCEPEMTMMLPMSNHSSSADLRPENQILFGIMKLPTYYDPSLKAKDRLAVVKMACDGLKNNPSLMATNVAIRGILSVLPSKICREVCKMKGLSLGISNTPGPQENISLWGSKVLDMAYWVPDVDPTGAGVGMLSYCGQVRMTIMVDGGNSATAAELAQMGREFSNEAEDLYCEFVLND